MGVNLGRTLHELHTHTLPPSCILSPIKGFYSREWPDMGPRAAAEGGGVVRALQSLRQKLYIAKPYTPETR